MIDFYNTLSERSQKLLDDIRYSRVLGASRHVKMIAEILLDVLSQEQETERALDRVQEVATYFKETRGSQTRAVYNAINEMLEGMDSLCCLPYDEAAAKLGRQIKDHELRSQENMSKIVTYTKALCETTSAVLLFDYSSTLDNAFSNAERKMKIIVPESRALNGGQPFLNSLVAKGHEVVFLPDTLLMTVLPEVGMAFIGAESFYPDGTAFNTVGSDILSVLCRELAVPLYVLTPLNKVDERNAFGHKRLSPMPFDFGNRLTENWDEEAQLLREKINFDGVKLVEIDPKYIKAYVTEKGIIPPEAMYSIVMQKGAANA